ncbi:MAG: caspase family protein [Roseiarcus sp.]
MTHRWLSPFLALLVLAGATTLSGAQTAQNPRIALVIAESAYPDSALATPANDAALVAQTLQAAGFDVVGARDLDEKSVRGAMRDFLAKAAAIGPSMQAFVYLSGRGVQYEGDNFLVPVDAQIARDSDVPIEAVRIADFVHALAAEPGQARILVIDAARANPYAAQGSPLAGGLALVEPDAGFLLAYNASPGSIAGDEPGPYGVYAKTLAGALREGGLPVDDVFAQTRVGVNEATGGAQIPWSASKLAAPYFVFERAADAPPAAAEAALADAAKRPVGSFPADQAYAAALERDTLAGYEEFLAAYPTGVEAKRVRAILAARREALFWRRAVAQDSAQAYWTYLSRYPRGPHVADAQRRLAILSAAAAPPADFAPEGYADLPPPPPDELVYADEPVFVFQGPDFGPPPPPPPFGFVADEGDDWRDLPPPRPSVEAGVLPALIVAIPLIATARAYSDAGGRAGRATPGAPPPIAQAPAPPLPGGVKPTPTPSPTRTPLKLVKPTPTPSPTSTRTPAMLIKRTPSPTPTPTPTPTKSVKPMPTSTPTPTPTPTRTPLKVVKPTPTPSPTPSPTPTPRPLKPPPAETAPKFVKPTPPAVVRTAPPSRAPEKPQEKKACGKPGEPACPK